MAERMTGDDDRVRKTRVFVSYSRKNWTFTDWLAGELIGHGYKVDYDRTHFDADNIDTGISAEDDWWKRLQEMIAACEAMVFVVSPDSAASHVCDEEITYARTLGKRVIPILLEQIDFSKAPSRLAALNVKLSFEDENARDVSLAALTKALDVDVAWHREGARLMSLAAKWDLAGRGEALLLPSGAVIDAEAWVARRPPHAEQPGELFGVYLAASGAKAKADRDRLLTSTGRGFVRPAEQALAEGRYEKALRLAAAGILLGEDFELRLVPELALSALNAAAASRWCHVFREGGLQSAKVSPDGVSIVTGSLDGAVRVWDADSGRQISVLRGHGGPIYNVALSPDGKRIAYTSDDWKARILDAADGRVLAVIEGHQRGITTIEFSPDGKRLVTAGHDHMGRVWDGANGRELALLSGHRTSVLTAKFSPDGARVVTASEDNTGRVWDANRGRQIAALRGHADWVLSAVFAPDGASIATAGNDSTARVWNAADGRQVRVLRGHGGAVTDVAYSADGLSIVTASFDKTARVWTAASGREIAILRGHQGVIKSAAFSPEGARVVTASEDNTARIWDALNGETHSVLHGHEGLIKAAEFTPNGLCILTTSDDATARMWDAAAGPQIAVLRGHKGSTKAAFSTDGQRILSAGADGTARIWSVQDCREIVVLKHEQALHGAKFSPDGSKVVTRCYDNKAYVWDAANGRRIAICRETKGELIAAAFSPDGARIATSSRIPTSSKGRTTRIWDTSAREIAVLRGGCWEIAFSPDGARIVTVDEHEAFIWDTATWRETAVLRGHTNSIRWARCSPDGLRVATASDDGTMRVWNAESGEQIASADLRGSVLSLDFSPDSESILATCENEVVRWVVTTGEIVSFRGHSGGILSIECSPDGTRVLSGSKDCTARIWDAATGREILRLRGHDATIESASFSPDGECVVTASFDGTVRLWAIGHTRYLLGHVAEVIAAALMGGRGVRAQAERHDLLMQHIEASDDDLCAALVSRMSRDDPEAGQRVAMRAEQLRKALHPDCYLHQSRRLGPSHAFVRQRPARGATGRRLALWIAVGVAVAVAVLAFSRFDDIARALGV